MERISSIQTKKNSRLFGQLLDKVVDKFGLVRCKTVQFVGRFLCDANQHLNASVIRRPSAIGTDAASLRFVHRLFFYLKEIINRSRCYLLQFGIILFGNQDVHVIIACHGDVVCLDNFSEFSINGTVSVRNLLHSSRLDRDAVGLKSCCLMFLVQRYKEYLKYNIKNQNKCYHFSNFNI